MARGIAIDLLQMAKRIGPQCEAAEYEDLSGEENLTLDRIATDDQGAIKPYGDDTVELSMKAPMSVSKPADLGLGVPNFVSKADGNRRQGTRCLPRFRPS